MALPVDLKYIVETEQEIGLDFPEKFKNKMCIENGGELITEDDNWELFPFCDKYDKKRMSRTCNHIVKENVNARDWNNFPNNGIAIATNGCGDYLILLPTNTDSKILSEEIYLWCHETGEINKVANNIDELADNID